MTPQQYERLTELFHAALEIAPDERPVFLDRVSESDADLRAELESLLAAHEQGSLTKKPPHDIAAGYLAQQGDKSANGPSLALNTRFDHYEIRSLLGKGGMGEVYLAEDLRLHRKVALKILPSEVAGNQDRMRRFEQEATAAAALNHPHIAHIYEIGESDSTHYIAIEHIDGETLRDKIHRTKAPLQKLLKYLTQVAEGLTKAHAAGIVHRDLKPDNIMITRDDYAKILDFGLAKLIEPQIPTGFASTEVSTAIMAQQSLAGMVMGTAGYMSPEQAQGKVKEIDHRSDIFSFGCILYEATTGQRPFADESVIKSLHKVVYESPPPIKDFNPSAPPDLQRIVRRCLAKDPDERYQTIKDVALELKEVRQGMLGAGELDTSVPPSGGTETSGRQTNEQSARSTSSAEYLVTEITRHKRSIAIILAVLVVAAGFGLYKLASQKRSTTTSLPANKITRVTATGQVSTGSISPDGKHVVYVEEVDGQQSIWVRQVATSSNVQIVPPSEANYSNFSFTHDGNYIYFNKREKNGPDSLYQMPSFGGTARKIIENLTALAAISLDDKRIAFVRGGFFADENSLVVANSDGTGEQVLATHKAPLNFYYGGITWNPDGKSVTCVSGPRAEKLIEVSLDGSAEKPIKTPKWFGVINVSWLPDRSGLIVTVLERSRSTPLQVWHLSYPSGEARKITNDFSNYADLSLTADASALVVIKRDLTSHIWLAPDGDAKRAKQLTTGTDRLDGFPNVTWTPDGRIVYDSTASGSIHTWIMNGDGSDQRQLTDGPYEDQGANVSPDGRYIVIASNRTGTQHIYRMDIDGSHPKQLTNGPGDAGPFFSPDGRWVIFTATNFISWKVPADGGEPVQLTDSWASDISSDGRLVAYVRGAGAGPLLWKIIIMPFEGGPRLNTFDVSSETRPNSHWRPDGRAIIYNLTHGGVLSGVTNLWIQPLDGGPPRQLTNFTSETFLQFDWSPDGKSLICGRRNTSSDVVMISDFR
ncbi:MAG TPA: protein kinase [Pyrinomonadaceae bacterium]|jgi:serine/threonine protein kinase|nr:protein kinase [Pyrinomonadaceae bacterium]